MRIFLFTLFLNLAAINSYAQGHAMLGILNVEKYSIELNLEEFTKTIKGVTTIEFVMQESVNQIQFDLVNPENGKTGMAVTQISTNEKIKWEHIGGVILINNPKKFKTNQQYKLEISFEGLPTDGLIISKNKHNDYTIFGDNWPNRAHYWFPCIDHPADKALVEFIVSYPSKYELIANGSLVKDSIIGNETKLAYYKSIKPLPTKVMVIGMAEFAISDPCMANKTEVTSWVFKQQKEDGFNDYAIACDVLKWFESKIDDYPFEKLANVQSKTRYGGMENASCIFYYEESVNGKQEVEDLIAHEIAHQWFGNSASESDWEHLWLSEGFATYLTDLYILDKYGEEAFRKRMFEERAKAIGFFRRYQAPVVDTLASDINMLLNPNSYQKGAWTLHMLRNEVGDSIFWQVLKNYYSLHKYDNASTNNFIDVVKKVTGTDYSDFFKQWLKTTGHPILEVEWKELKSGQIDITVKQKQKEIFAFDIPIYMSTTGLGKHSVLKIEKKKQSFRIECSDPVLEISLDEQVKLFFEGKVIKK